MVKLHNGGTEKEQLTETCICKYIPGLGSINLVLDNTPEREFKGLNLNLIFNVRHVIHLRLGVVLT